MHLADDNADRAMVIVFRDASDRLPEVGIHQRWHGNEEIAFQGGGGLFHGSDEPLWLLAALDGSYQNWNANQSGDTQITRVIERFGVG
jgi:hypothetical protein